MTQTKDLDLNVVDKAVESALENLLHMAKDMGCDVLHINYPKMWYVEQWCTTNDIYFT